MKLDEIELLWEEDSKIDSGNLNEESLKIPQLHNKYFKILNQEILSLKYLETQKYILRKKKWAYYNGISIDENKNDIFPVKRGQKLTKDDINALIEGDDDWAQTISKINYISQKIVYLESIIKEITQRTWHIKNVIEWRKFSEP